MEPLQVLLLHTNNLLTKMFFILLQVRDKEKIQSPHEELNLRPLDSSWRLRIFLLSHTPEKAKTSFPVFYRTKQLPSFLFYLKKGIL